MNVRKYNENDFMDVVKLGTLLHDNYVFSLNEFSKCLVIEKDFKVVGFIIYDVIYERAEIVDVIIAPAYRKMGYGIKLVTCAIEDINNYSCKNITLEVNCKNKAAISLYRKVGFKIEAVRKNYYKKEDAYLMNKYLGMIK